MSDQEPTRSRTEEAVEIHDSDRNVPSASKPPGKSVSSAPVESRVRNITNWALNFLSTASNETLGACGVGLCASTYLVLGRVGLVLIGAVGGVILHATWDGATSDGDAAAAKGAERRTRKETGGEIAKRVLEWRDRREESTEGEAKDAMLNSLNYSAFQPRTGAALTVLTDAIIRDYVKWWYGPILPRDETFPASCRKTLTRFILSFSNHVSRKRPADTFLEFLTNSSSIIIVFLDELSAALMSAQTINQSPGDAVRRYLMEEPESNLANVLSLKQQERKLALVAEDILQNFLDAKAYGCEPVRVFLQEVLAGLVLEMTVTTCSKPEWINGWIVYLLEDGEPELMNAIDAGVEGMRGVSKPAQDATDRAEAENEKLRKGHQRRVSKAEEAMDEAMIEAKRLSKLIAEEDARRQPDRPESETSESISTATTEGMATPTSTDSDRNGYSERGLASSTMQGQPLVATEPKPVTPPHPMTKYAEPGLATTPETATAIRPAYFSPTPSESPATAVLTLHNASVTIFDDAEPGDKSTFKAKPATEYLLQIEPASSRFPGWMIPRKYTDFETLHEVLRRISVISGVSGFVEKHATLPTWKGQSKNYLRQNLERYLQQALQFEPLAESEGMRRFLEKDTGMAAAPASKNPFAFKGPAALENVGKGIVDVLGNAPKGIAGGGKAVLGGVQGVFGAVGVGGPRKGTPLRSLKSASVASLPKNDSYTARPSHETLPPANAAAEPKGPPLPQRPNRTASTASAMSVSSEFKQPQAPADSIEEQLSLNLPPPPSSIDDDYGIAKPVPHHVDAALPVSDMDLKASKPDLATRESPISSPPEPKQKTKTAAPLTEEETRIAVELFFAIINELYTLSSAWNIRLTLLSAAKSFLLRPGNPNLEAIRVLLQDSVIDANFSSDSAIATQILKLRANTLPTEEELKLWPPEPSAEEKEKLRKKARKLLVERGMPQALTSVMGAAASGEALGRVFDCLQIEEVSRGFIFALLLQAIRATTQ